MDIANIIASRFLKEFNLKTNQKEMVMKLKNSFHLAIVFFMVLAIALLGVYEYVCSDMFPERGSTMQQVMQYAAMPGYASDFGSLFVDPYYLYPSSLTISPSITQYQTPIISDWFRPNWSNMLLPEVSPWYRSPTLPEYGPQFSIQEQLQISTSDRFYNLTDFTGVDYLYSLGMISPMKSNWNVYQQTDLYVLPASQKYTLYEFTKGFEVGPRKPDIWMGYGGRF